MHSILLTTLLAAIATTGTSQEIVPLPAALTQTELQNAIGVEYSKFRIPCPHRNAKAIQIQQVVYSTDGILLKSKTSTTWHGIEAGKANYDVTVIFHDGKIKVMVDGFQYSLNPKDWHQTRHFVHSPTIHTTVPKLGIQALGHEYVLDIQKDGSTKTSHTGKSHGLQFAIVPQGKSN